MKRAKTFLSKLIRFLRSQFAKETSLPHEVPIPIQRYVRSEANEVTNYWTKHTVQSTPFKNARESLKYVDWIDEQYPLYHEFMQLYLPFNNQVVLDYGCGPANDLVGFLHYSAAKKVIGVDVSEKALRLGSYRLGLHDFDPQRIELILITESIVGTPLEDASVDYIHSQGVLHHTTNPEGILGEFFRILKPGSQARIMVYNYFSIFVQLFIAYKRMIIDDAYKGLTLPEAFTRSTDGKDCPISFYNRPEEFIAMCTEAGFQTEYVGGYFNIMELDWLKKYQARAMKDDRLATEHREFISNLSFDQSGYPLYQDKHAGIGGVYLLSK